MIIWLISYMVIWLFGHMVIWLCGYLQLHGYMVIWLKDGGQGAYGRLSAEVIRYLVKYSQYTLHIL